MTTQIDYGRLADKLAPYLLRYLRTTPASATTNSASGLIPHDLFGPAHTGVPDTFPPEAHDHDDLVWWRVTASSARLWGGEITDNGDGTVTIAAGAGLVLADEAGPEDGPAAIDDGQASAPSLVEWDEDAAVTLTDNAYNYIYITSAGAVAATTDFYTISFTQEFTVGRVYRSGTTVTIRLCGTNAWNFNRRVQLFGEEVFPVVRAKGFILGSTGTRNLTITKGVLWAELVNRFTVGWGVGMASDFDSSGTDTWTYYYRNGSGGWTTSASATQINNTQYDDGDGTLGTLTANRYGVHWVYVVHDASVHILFGQGDYTLAQAEASTPPASIPGLLAAYGTLIGRVLVQKSSNTLLVESAFDVTFASSGVISHNDLSDLTTGDPHTQYILKSTFDANTILKADSDDTPVALTVGASTLVGRAASGGIAALSASDARTVLGLATTNTVQFDQVQAIRDGGQAAFFLASYRDTAIGSLIQMATARGSVATPAVSQLDDRVGWFGAYGYSAAAGAFRTCAAVAFFIDGEPDTGGDTTDMPGRIAFQTAPDGTSTLTDRMTIKSTGDVGIGTTSPSTRLDIDAGAMEFAEMTAPSGGAANTARLFARDNGSGKTQLCVIFNTGAIQVLATEP